MPRLFATIPLLALVSCVDAPATDVSERHRPPVSRLEPRPEWFEFDSNEMRLAVEFPREPTRKTMLVQAPTGALEVTSYELVTDDVHFIVSTFDHANEPLTDAELQTMLDSSSDGVVAQTGGELISERRLTIAGVPGRRLLIRASVSGVEFNLHEIHCMVGNRAYQAMVLQRPSIRSEVEVERFFASFTPRRAR